jgi:hypothetical protein
MQAGGFVSQPRKNALLVFDLDGVLVSRLQVSDPRTAGLQVSNSDAKGEVAVGARLSDFVIWKRPGVDELLRFAVAHFDVGVWSSAPEADAQAMAWFAFGDLAARLRFIYGRSRCELAVRSGGGKPLWLKNLAVVWRAFPEYGPRNTLLIDDSDEKPRNNPRETRCNPGKWTREQSAAEALRSERKIWEALTALAARAESRATPKPPQKPRRVSATATTPKSSPPPQKK